MLSHFGFLNVFDKRFGKKLSKTFNLHAVFQVPKIVILIFVVPQTVIYNYGTWSASSCKYLLCAVYVTPRKYVTIAKTKDLGYIVNLLEASSSKAYQTFF